MFHSNQTKASSGILSAYKAGVRYSLLRALCQSGKTGTFQSLIQRMLNDEEITHAYILCGSSETELKKQAVNDTQTFNLDFYQKGRIQVLFHQDFLEATMDIQNALIVIDESHMVQTKGQQLHQFLLNHGIKMDGDPTVLKEKNAYVLSVDATPYSELAALVMGETPYEKHVEDLLPGTGYYGLADYDRDYRLLSTFSISKEPERFEELLLSTPAKYVLMRMTRSKSNEANEAELRRICKRNHFPILLYTGEKTQVAMTLSEQKRYLRKGQNLPCLMDAPLLTTVVIVRGRLRAGKVVPKVHVGFIWEGASKSKTDALVQGLPGRMCGYVFGDVKPLLFVPPTALVPDELTRVLSDELPKTATNMRAGQMTNGQSVFSVDI
jgi:hypothetical protein